MDLSQASSWISADQLDNTISGAFEQKQDNLPKVVWGMNTIPYTAGIKSLTAGKDAALEDLPALTTPDPLFSLDAAIDRNGSLHYLALDDTIDGVKKRLSYNAFSSEWKTITSGTYVNSYFHRRQTVFQNQTVYAHTTVDSFDPSVQIVGDAPSGNDVFFYADLAHQVQVFNLSGMNLNPLFGVQGITSHQNYLLFWDFDTVYWSNPIDFTDFTPSIGGGGNTKIAEARGNILTIVPNPTGLMIYCKYNIVHAAFSGDATNPWIFTEVAGSEGLLISIAGQPLVTSNESSAIQMAVTPTGIVSVADNGVQPLNVSMLEMFDDLAVEKKDIGTVDFTRKFYDYTGELLASTKIYNIKLIGRELFIMSGKSTNLTDKTEYTDGRMHVLNLQTNKVSLLEGTYLDVSPKINLSKTLAGGVNMAVRPDIQPNSYVGAIRDTIFPNAAETIVLDFAGTTDRDIGSFNNGTIQRDAEFLVGNISVSRENTTIIHSVMLDGRLHADSDTLGTKRAKVFGYSKSSLGASNPVEFTYNTGDGRYYGHVEGKDLLIEVRGENFYLTGMEVEIEQGGIF